MLHGHFATGRYTSTVLFVLSMLVMVSAHWLPLSAPAVVESGQSLFLGGIVPRVIALLMYLFSAVLLSGQTFFDNRVRWMGALYMWMVALSTFVNGNSLVALSSLLFLVSVLLLFFGQYSTEPVGALFTSFMLLGVQALLTPLSLYFVPLCLAFCPMANIFSAKGLAASLLGFITPFWLVLGAAYVFPQVNIVLEPFLQGLPTLLNIQFPGLDVLHLLQLLFVLVVLLPATFAFVGSTSPAKPLLRRRMSFVILANIYLLVLFCLVGGSSALFYMCQLPFVAVLASYLLARKETWLLNVYLIVINLIMVAIATHRLWLTH